MKNSGLGKVGALLLITGIAFAARAYIEKHTGPGAMSMGEKCEHSARKMAGLMNDMSSEMKKMSGMIDSDSMNPDTMKKMSSRMKKMGSMMNDMSGMMDKNMAMDAGMQKQMDQMRKDMMASPAMK